jgi:Photosynthetic reaction centre cytochrome C subunit
MRTALVDDHAGRRVPRRRAVVLAAVVFFGAAVQARQRPQPPHATSGAYNAALGVECIHCHAATDSSTPAQPALDFARRMEQMVQGLNEGPLRGLGGVNCWTCHRGRPVPARLPSALWEPLAQANQQVFAGRRDGLDITMSVYAASLGTSCTHCHEPGDWASGARPAHRLTARMLAIFDLIPRYFDPAVRMPRTQCYMCHQGSTRVPNRSPG